MPSERAALTLQTMNEIDWNARATVHERDDGGSDRFVDFRTLATGTLAEMVRFVSGMPVEERARVVLDAEGHATMTVSQIAALAARPDFPGS